MGTISSSVGLISGIDLSSLVQQLMQIEARPLRLLEQRILNTQAQQEAFSLLNISLRTAQDAIDRLSRSSSFQVKKASSSNPSVLTASAGTNTPVDSFAFHVKSLVSSHQLVSTRGYATRDTTPIGAGTITFRNAQARVDPVTTLGALNGGAGVRRGIIRITDQTGATADVDLRFAVTTKDVLDAINGASGINVRAGVSGDRFVITDLSGGGGSLSIQDVQGGFAATDLGIAGSAANGEIVGQDLIHLTAGTALSSLNDGIGLRHSTSGPDLKVTLSNGREFRIDFTTTLGFKTSMAELNDGQGVGAGTVRITNQRGETMDLVLNGDEAFEDVNALIQANDPSFGVSITSISSSGQITVVDSTGGTTSRLKIEDVSGNVASRLSLAGEAAEGSSSISGFASYRFDTLGAVLRRIEYAKDTNGQRNNGDFSVAISGNRLAVTDHTGTAGLIEAENGSMALRDLGLDAGFNNAAGFETRDLIAGMNTVLLSSLNGGQGMNLGQVTFTLRDGSTTGTVDFSDARTLNDVIDRINAVPGLGAQVSSGRMGLVITDTTGGTGQLAINGAGLDDLGLELKPDGRLSTDNLHRQYIHENTTLATLNNGQGIRAGSFLIIDSSGASATVTINTTAHRTIGDVLKSINALNIGVEARINGDGDGIMLVDTAGGSGALNVTAVGGAQTAADLKLLGTVENNTISGSFAGRIEIGSNDTLDTLVTKINEAGLGVRAGVINDGGTVNPFRLVITATQPGTAGRMLFEVDAQSLNFDTLREARDARLVIGDPDSPHAVVLTSSSNTVTGVVDGLTLNLEGVSNDPVQVSVTRDLDQVVEDIQEFIETFNATMNRIDELTRFDPDTLERGALFGDRAVRMIQDRLFRAVSGVANHPSLTYTRLSQVGINVARGARLEFDEDRFREEFAKDPEGVRRLFTFAAAENDQLRLVGFGARLRDELNRITNQFDGLIVTENRRLQDRVDLFERRAESLQVLLNRKEARLFAQFQGMERALADLQSQQSSISALANMVTAMSAGGFGIQGGR